MALNLTRPGGLTILPRLNVSILPSTAKIVYRMDFYASLTQLSKIRFFISLFLVACLAHVIYIVAKQWLEYRVSTI